MSEHLGPIDYLLIEFAELRFDGTVADEVLRLVAAGTVRLLDVAVVTKDASGDVAIVELADLSDEEVGALRGIENFIADVIAEEELLEAAVDLPAGTSAVLLVWENTWAAPFVAAVRAAGGVALERCTPVFMYASLSFST